jgi:hypothetical protein
MFAPLLIAACLVGVDERMSADQIHAALQQGIKTKSASTRSKSKVPHKSNRVWTAGELIAKFGEPASRVSTGGKVAGGSGERERWIWGRDDGTVKAWFFDRGYGNADDPKTLRLEIIEVGIARPEGGSKKKAPAVTDEEEKPVRKPATTVEGPGLKAPSPGVAEPAVGKSDPLRGRFAKVQVLSGGEFVALQGDVPVSTDDRYFHWSNIPTEFKGFRFLRNREQQGTTKFQITSPGIVLVAVIGPRYSGNSGGGWQKEIVTQKDLEAQGWREIGKLDSRFKDNSNALGWVVFARDCKKGESFSYRTEKYVAPVLLLK